MLDQVTFSDPRGKQSGYLWCYHARNDSAYGRIGLPVAVVGKKPGPTFLLLGSGHGDEYIGQAVLTELFHSLDPDKINGRVVICPTVALPAAQAGTRFSPYDGMNQNMVYPGDPSGSVTQKIAALVTQRLIAKADYMADVHSGGRSLEYMPGAFLPLSGKADVDVASFELATAFGAGSIYLLAPGKGAPLHATGTAHSRGIPALAMEIGGTENLDPKLVAMTRQGLLNMLSHVGMMEVCGKPKTSRSFLIRPEHYLIAPDDGVFVAHNKLGDRVNKGAVAGHLFHGTALERLPVTVSYPSDGILVCARRIAKSTVGDCLLHLASPAADIAARLRKGMTMPIPR